MKMQCNVYTHTAGDPCPKKAPQKVEIHRKILLKAAGCLFYFGEMCALCMVAIIFGVYLSWLHIVCSSSHFNPIYKLHYSYQNQATIFFHWQLLSGKQGPLCPPNSLCDTSSNFRLFSFSFAPLTKTEKQSILPYLQWPPHLPSVTARSQSIWRCHRDAYFWSTCLIAPAQQRTCR